MHGLFMPYIFSAVIGYSTDCDDVKQLAVDRFPIPNFWKDYMCSTNSGIPPVLLCWFNIKNIVVPRLS